ncbi:hypothetical protein LDI01_18360 [Lentilactobacillus diolivorans]|uniref:Uncharacterized protein n=1 Tax=Lentilactobacillus diolivorans TaxID=179838 RepID=A0ABQ0XFY4_9LACO|nr:hypothetical protein LDI01_18360 [Lentilactobacillus diolivorans]
MLKLTSFSEVTPRSKTYGLSVIASMNNKFVALVTAKSEPMYELILGQLT